MGRYKKNQTGKKPKTIATQLTAKVKQSVNQKSNLATAQANSLLQNADQKRAAFALKEVKSRVESLKQPEQKEFKSYVQALPAMVQMNGLGQAIAFCRSHYTESDISKKGAAAYKSLYTLIQTWLCDENLAVYSSQHDLLEQITTHDMNKYRLATSELQSLLTWLKKMVAAFIIVENEQEAK